MVENKDVCTITVRFLGQVLAEGIPIAKRLVNRGKRKTLTNVAR
jgi:hypothetical protein